MEGRKQQWEGGGELLLSRWRVVEVSLRDTVGGVCVCVCLCCCTDVDPARVHAVHVYSIARIVLCGRAREHVERGLGGVGVRMERRLVAIERRVLLFHRLRSLHLILDLLVTFE